MRRIPVVLWSMLCCTTGVPSLTSGQEAHRREDILLIRSVSIVDVESGSLRTNMDIVVASDTIAEISATPLTALPESAREIDGRGLFVIPGLFDSHVHYVDPATFGSLMIANGVVFVRDMGNPTSNAIAMREKLKHRALLGPEMVTTGSVLDGVPPAIPQISIPCATPEEGKEAVRRQVSSGVDEIKVYSGLSKPVFLAIAEEAGRRGVKVVGHVPEDVSIRDAAKAGQASAEHLFGFGKVIASCLGEPVSPSTKGMGTDVPYFLRVEEVPRDQWRSALLELGSCGLHVCPTLVVFKHGAHLKEILSGTYPLLEYASPSTRAMWRAMWGQQPENPLLQKILKSMQTVTRDIQENGIPLMVGTDLISPGVVAGFSVHEEMVLWQEAGIAAADILRSATVIPARFMGVGDRLGVVKRGMTASFVLLRSNPLLDIRNTTTIESVVFRGEYLSRGELDRLLQGVRAVCRP